MWAMFIMFVVFLICRFGIRAYQQNQILNDIAKIEVETRAKLLRKHNEYYSPSFVEEEETQTDISTIQEEDDEEENKGHNVTKILTAAGSKKFHLNPEQIEQGKSLNKELLETLAKRKIHTE